MRGGGGRVEGGAFLVGVEEDIGWDFREVWLGSGGSQGGGM